MALAIGRERLETPLRRLSAGTVSASIAVMFMGSTVLTPLYVLYRQRFGFSELMLTLVYAVYVIGNLLALLVLGRVSDQIGRRPAMLPAVGLAVVSTLLFLFAASTPWLFIGRAVSGLAIGVASGTATAWLAELYPEQERPRAALAATSANYVGLAIGALLAGTLAQYAPWPLRLPYLVYLAILLVTAVLIALARETVAHREQSIRRIAVHPRLGVPAGIRREFTGPAVAAFATFSLLGFYFALAPSVLARDLHVTSHAIGGAIVAMLCLTATCTAFSMRKLSSRNAMLGGLALMVPCLALLVLAESMHSMAVLLLATALSGASSGLGYRGTLQVVNDIAPPSQRAEVISSYLIACYAGNSLPVIGVGILSMLAGQLAASAAFAGVIALFALAAFWIGLRFIPRAEASHSP